MTGNLLGAVYQKRNRPDLPVLACPYPNQSDARLQGFKRD